ncbi:hypothetical protein HNP54_004119 [Tsukamurella ocularis]|nr:hypothetical protein [Tsukamurella ocularis]
MKIAMIASTSAVVLGLLAPSSVSAEMLAPGDVTVLSRCTVFPTNEPCTAGIARDPGARPAPPVVVPAEAPAGPSGSGPDGGTVQLRPGPGAIGGR